MSQLTQPGVFRAKVVEYQLTEKESGAVAVTMQFQILEQFRPGEGWQNWSEFETQEIIGDTWVITKEGKLNEPAINQLTKACGPWDFQAISDKTWQPADCQITVQPEEYKGKTKLKVAWVNDYNRDPIGLGGSVAPNRAKELANRFGAQLRALTGNVARNTQTPNGRPPAPPRDKLDEFTEPPAYSDVPETVPATGDGIPF